ncbi:MAG: glycyl-radical enzyme activating protein [Verrucomicrobiales bacterium]|jgi:pyruvate formate lyase activating enzyme|nr:glycyl-radical enzyme activating protein [Verrucomicrobiales bacterium]
MTGIVTDIQRFSLHDGPGIRSTVFLKGCHLHCAWCHNPETIGLSPELLFYAQNCIGCGECVEVCPEQNHHFDSNGSHRIAREHCRACGICSGRCPASGLRIAGKRMKVEGVMAEILEDEAFYHEGGGVTLSGGEPVIQAKFAREILQACRNAGIHTAIETTLCYPWSRLEPLLPALDLVIFDIKAFDSGLHRRYTGADNHWLFKNLALLNRSGKALIARTPLIAGINDSVAEIEKIVAVLKPLRHLLYYEFLPYHPLGTGKYAALGLPAPRLRAPDAETLRLLADTALSAGMKLLINGTEEHHEIQQPIGTLA